MEDIPEKETSLEALLAELSALRERVSALESESETLRRHLERYRASEDRLAETEALLRAALDQSPVGVAIASAPDGTLQYVNDAGLLIRGGSREQLVDGVGIQDYVRSWQLYSLDNTPLRDDEVPLARAIFCGESCSRECIIRRDNHDDRIILANAAPIRDRHGAVTAGIAIFQDITEQKHAESEREIMLSQLRLLNLPNGIHELLQNVTRLMREWSGCDAVGIRLRDDEDFPYYETRGFSDEFVQAETHLCAKDEQGNTLRDSTGNPIIECMCGNVICGRFDPKFPFFTENGSFWSNCTTELLASTTDEDRQTRTRNRCNGEGYESVALIPLRYGDETLGLLQFNDFRRDRFTKKKIALLERLAANLAVGLVQRKAAAALNDSEAKYRALFENMRQGAFYQRADGRLLDINPAALDMFGITREEFLRRTSENPEWEVVQENGAPLPGNEHPSMVALRTGKAIQKAVVGVRNERTGERVWMEISAIPEFHPGQDAPYQVMVTLHDITARKHIEQLLRESETFLKESQRIARLGSWKVNLQTDYLFWSEGVYAIIEVPLDYRPSLAEGLRYYRPEYLPGLKAKLNHCLETGETFIHECELVTATGKRLWIEVRGFAPDSDGENTYVMGTLQDITERKHTEELLRQAGKMESVGRLAGGVAHDFNNMLGVILGHVEMALEEMSTLQPAYANLKEIQKTAQRSANLTRQLLAFARKQTVTPKVLDLNATIEDMLKMIKRLIGENIELFWTPGEALWPLKMDPGQIDQLLANLCVNARDAMRGGGSIVIATENVHCDEASREGQTGRGPGDYILLTVRDTGAGMDAQTLEHVFEPFFTTKEVGQGSGLGLATVYGIVMQNKGCIQVKSEPGRGTLFQIHFPKAETEAEAEQDTNKSGTVDRAPHGETILIVEDERSMLEIGAAILRRNGYNVLEAETPAEALRLAGTYPGDIHLLLSDVILPGMNGKELAETLLLKFPRMKIIFMSGYTADVIASQGIVREGVHFLAKPFSRQELSVKVLEALVHDGPASLTLNRQK